MNRTEENAAEAYKIMRPAQKQLLFEDIEQNLLKTIKLFARRLKSDEWTLKTMMVRDVGYIEFVYDELRGYLGVSRWLRRRLRSIPDNANRRAAANYLTKRLEVLEERCKKHWDVVENIRTHRAVREFNHLSVVVDAVRQALKFCKKCSA